MSDYKDVNEKTKTIFRITMGVLFIVLVLITSAWFIRRLPVPLKIAAIALNVATIYYVYRYLIKKKNKNIN